MVGEDAGVAGGVKMAEVFSKYIGMPHKHGGKGDGGIGCLYFVYDILKALGKADNLILEVDGVNLDNYEEFAATSSQRQIRDKLVKAFALQGDEVSRPKIGDLLVLQNEIGEYFPAVYIGGGNVASSFYNCGVQAAPMRMFYVISIRRVK